MLSICQKRIEAEQAEDVLAEMASGGYLPGHRVSRHLLLPVNFPFGPHKIVAKYGPAPGFCFTDNDLILDDTPIPVDESYDEVYFQWALVEVSGTIPEDAEPCVHKCNEIELDYGENKARIYDLLDLDAYGPSDVLAKARWPRDIRIGSAGGLDAFAF